ncbi:hypothetical protein [Rhodoligotrophos defluvii]|uniref:hypothetical protein n=1 Tax=Rhodoligotrophos defluvii TaxID=2561934 RepID=UPI0010C9DCB4|nr:hypothetical protein [Rhodoligotrophos defluvii]
MKRDRFISSIRRHCRKNGMAFAVGTVAGKGSHGKVRVSDRATIVKDGELSPVYRRIVLRQLGLPEDLD